MQEQTVVSKRTTKLQGEMVSVGASVAELDRSMSVAQEAVAGVLSLPWWLKPIVQILPLLLSSGW